MKIYVYLISDTQETEIKFEISAAGAAAMIAAAEADRENGRANVVGFVDIEWGGGLGHFISSSDVIVNGETVTATTTFNYAYGEAEPWSENYISLCLWHAYDMHKVDKIVPAMLRLYRENMPLSHLLTHL